jgi:hypothetical protein
MNKNSKTRNAVGCWAAMVLTILALWVASHIDTEYKWPASHPEYNDFRN